MRGIYATLLACAIAPPAMAIPLLSFFDQGNSARGPVASSLTYLQAFYTSTSALQSWFVANTGSRIALTKSATGTVTVTTQTDVANLAGELVTGQIVVAGSNIDLEDFGVVAPAGLGTADANHLILISLAPGVSNVTVGHFKADGANEIATQGIGGDHTASNVTFHNGEVTGTGDDGAKAVNGTAFIQMYIHSLRPWVTAVDGTWVNSNNDTAQPHQDGIQAQEGDTVIYQSWVESSDSPTATSATLSIPAYSISMTFKATYSYFSGSAVQSIQARNDTAGTLTGAGGNTAIQITAYDFENNLISPNYGSYPNSPWSILLYQDVVTVANNLTADTRVPIAPPTLATRPVSASSTAALLLNIL